MPSFVTPDPISATVELSVGNVAIVASDRADTVVEVRPSDPENKSDVETAAATRIDHIDGALAVHGPKSRTISFSRKTRSVEVVIMLPTGSRVHIDTAVGETRSTGVLGECRVKNSVGQVHLYRTGPLRVDTGAGDVTVEVADGSTEISTGSGQVRVGTIGGTAVVKNANGDIDLGEVEGTLRVRSAVGAITVGKAGADVEATSASGNIRVGEIACGRIDLNSSTGGIEIGIAEGTAAWLDLKTGFGRVQNSLDTGDGPDESENRAEVRANTTFGDISVRRA
ncbi:DUF4097 family beta strand repeat-containing protein [Amycolatopsis sp. cmx-4-68]|uniref:DUF4097 family beta strand repeat-containing protein n=1 Tax=Amycolatopsis sp. cmx-4-68 TaxID=2790938 RepID=UPI00397DCD2D